MITRPTCRQVLDGIREDLRNSVAPAVTEQQALVVLGMIDSVLATVGARCDGELARLHEEIEDVRHLAELVVRGADDREVMEPLSELRRATHAGIPTDSRAQYERAGALLAICFDRAFEEGGELRRAADGILERRIKRLSETHGALTVHGR